MKRSPLLLCAVLVAACASQPSDTPKPISPSTLGKSPIRSLVNPNLPGHAALVNNIVSITGTAVVAVDNFDETEDGKARGNIYVQDHGSLEPYSGIALYSPSFSPADLKPVPGDVLDWSGVYREADGIGSSKFRMEGNVQPLMIQLEKPTGKPRFDGSPVAPREIPVTDLFNYASARPWLGMLVTVKNVVVASAPTNATGRQQAKLYPIGDGEGAGATLANELMPLDLNIIKKQTTFESVTGVVIYAFGVHLSPRSPEDFQGAVVAPSTADAGTAPPDGGN